MVRVWVISLILLCTLNSADISAEDSFAPYNAYFPVSVFIINQNLFQNNFEPISITIPEFNFQLPAFSFVFTNIVTPPLPNVSIYNSNNDVTFYNNIEQDMKRLRLQKNIEFIEPSLISLTSLNPTY